MDSEAPADPSARFAALHAESLELLEATRSLVGEMRGLLEECQRRRPPRAPAALAGPAGSQAGSAPRSHRGARIRKGRRPRPR